jgi:predicted phosphodiesterase
MPAVRPGIRPSQIGGLFNGFSEGQKVTGAFKDTAYRGLLIIGDPHLEARVPGFRKDNYPNVILEKLGWCLAYAAKESLLPAILGDLFHLPRDNPNWLLVKLIQLFDHEIIAIYGNHDVHENEISEHDSLSILAQAGRVRMLDGNSHFRGTIGGRAVIVGGTPWGQWLPKFFDAGGDGDETVPLVFWLAHHDIVLPGYEELGRFKPAELPGIDCVINGHIHRRLESVQTGATSWITPGNISRRTRSDATRAHVPSVLRIDIDGSSWKPSFVEIPHQPFDDIFHETIVDAAVGGPPSPFIAGLAELQRYRTQTGEGLTAFLDRNLTLFDDAVATEIRQLAEEVLENV